jgi:hypothetical protein
MATKEDLLAFKTLGLELLLHVIDVVSDTNWYSLVVDNVWNSNPKRKWDFLLNELQVVHVSGLITLITDEENNGGIWTCFAFKGLEDKIFSQNPLF